jgi:hypothetical protein
MAQRWYSSARCAMFLDAAWDGLEVLGKFDRNPWESMRNQCFFLKFPADFQNHFEICIV